MKVRTTIELTRSDIVQFVADKHGIKIPDDAEIFLNAEGENTSAVLTDTNYLQATFSEKE